MLTKGGDRYSRPILLALRVVERTSFVKLYLSMRKLSVGPSESLTIRSDGAKGVKVNASKCDTPSAGPIVKKSFILLRFRS